MCLLAALLFCAVTYGGCGGGHDGDPVSGNTAADGDSGRQSGWDDWEELDDFSVFENTWKISDIELRAEGYGSNIEGYDWNLVSKGMVGSTFRITVTDRDAAENSAILNLSRELLGVFRLIDYSLIEEPLLPDGETLIKRNEVFTTEPDLTDSYFMIYPQNNGKRLVVYNVRVGQPAKPESYTITTTLDSVY